MRMLNINDERTLTFRAWRLVRKNLNFYRIHIIFFTLTPLIFAAIFYASNGEYKIAYVDALFNCVSVITGTGLQTVDLSSLTTWQQVILFLLAWFGSPVTVSWIMVSIRRYYFAKKFEHLLEDELARRAVRSGRPHERIKAVILPSWSSRISEFFDSLWWGPKTNSKSPKESVEPGQRPDDREIDAEDVVHSSSQSPRSTRTHFRPDMIRRIEDEQPRLVDPNGQLTTPSPPPEISPLNSSNLSQNTPLNSVPEEREPSREHIHHDARHAPMARLQTIDFALAPTRSITHGSFAGSPRAPGSPAYPRVDAGAMAHTMSLRSASAYVPPSQRTTRDSGFGGFPTPDQIILRFLARFFPNAHQRLERRITMPSAMALTPSVGRAMHRTGTISSAHKTVREVPYISFDAVVGHNSEFRMLTSDQLDELGGVEYRALNALRWIIPCYQVGIQAACFIIIVPYMAEPRWAPQYLPPNQHKPINEVWFSLFQVISAYTNIGMSLVDQSLIPFQTAYLMLVVIPFLILAGNTGFPVFLRLFIWTIKKLCPRGARLDETLHFLLDHPRRCFVYLFPSTQTWFLAFILVMLNGSDWLSFMVLDIGNPSIDAIPLGTRFLLGLVQSASVRCAGFATVTVAALSPAVKVMYVLMMYVSAYPISISVRSTNVYEDRSFGIFAAEEGDDDVEDEDPAKAGIHASKPRVWGRYVGTHVRKQLAFDMWWLGLSVFLICIIERANLNNESQLAWFNIFAVVFEVVSAYGTVGLSLGIPTKNYSLSGDFHVLSKLIICAVMLRGRHRGLPVAIDRAVMLPSEFTARPNVADDPADDLEEHSNELPLQPMPGSDHDTRKKEDIYARSSSDHGTMASRGEGQSRIS